MEEILKWFLFQIKSNNQIDTLSVLTFINDSSSIGFIDANMYDRIKLNAKLFANDLKGISRQFIQLE